MVKSKSDFPHPVLAVDGDDYKKEYYFTCKLDEDIIEDEDKIELHVLYELHCEFLSSLIFEEKAVVSLYVESPNSSFRKIFYFDKDDVQTRIKINKSDIAKKLIVKPYIFAKENMDNYCSEMFNPDYFEGAIFSVRKGDILAFEKQYEVLVEDINEFKNCASVFSIRLDESVANGIKVNYNDEKINVLLNKQDHEKYAQLRERQEFRIFLSAMVVFPALVESIEAMKREYVLGEEGISEKRWFLALEKQMDKKGILLSETISSVYVANTLLGDILKSSLIELENVVKQMNWGEDN